MASIILKHRFSIIYGYRNRDIERVRRSVQSLAELNDNSFDVVFVDYGSDEEYSVKVRELLIDFSFVKYVYNETRAWPWNRAHALNSGIKYASSDFIFTADVDLIFTKDFLKIISSVISYENVVFFSVYMLPSTFTDWQGVNNYTNYPKTTNQGTGISLIPKSFFIERGGYNELFSIWGYEDNELFRRVSNKKLRSVFYDSNPVAYHQWHLNAYENPAIFPKGWRSFMKNIFLFEKNQRLCFDNQGVVYSYHDRKALMLLENNNIKLDELRGDENYMRYLMQSVFNNLSKGEYFACFFTETTYSEYHAARLTRLIRSVNSWLSRFNAGFQLTSKYEALHLSTHHVRDLILYFVINNKQKILDFAYVLSGEDKKITFVVIKA